MKKEFLLLEAKTFLLVFTIGFLPEALAQPRCQKSFSSSTQTDLFSWKKKKASTLREAKADLIHGLVDLNLKNIKQTLINYPSLKNIRLTKEDTPRLLSRIRETNLNWCPKGWGLLHLAAYFKKPELLDLLLELGVNIRTKKRKGGESIEDNVLHVSIKRNFKEGVDTIFKHYPKERFGQVRRRFIDEKTRDKKTPWFLAIRRDVHFKNTLFTNLIGQYGPSGHVESYVIGRGAKDGFETARATHNDSIIILSNRYLQISQNYKEQKAMKQRAGKRTMPPWPNK